MAAADKATVGIVGGGRGGAALLKILLKSGFVDIRFIVDPNPEAVAFRDARRNDIKTFSGIQDACRTMSVEYLFEATGVEAVYKQILEHCPEDMHVIDSKTSHFFFDLLEKTRAAINAEVVSELTEVQKVLKVNTAEIQDSLDEVEKVTSNISLLSINASIEGARAGESGKGFAVVAKEVQKTAENAQALSRKIEGVNQESEIIVSRIDEALKKLKEN